MSTNNTTKALIEALPKMLLEDMQKSGRTFDTWADYYKHLIGAKRQREATVHANGYGTIKIDLEGNSYIQDSKIEEAWDDINEIVSLPQSMRNVLYGLPPVLNRTGIGVHSNIQTCLEIELPKDNVAIVMVSPQNEDQIKMGLYRLDDWEKEELQKGLWTYDLEPSQTVRILEQLYFALAQ